MGKLAKVYEVSDCSTIGEVLDRSETNWDAEMVTPRDINPGGFKAIIRPDTMTALHYVSDRYKMNRHREQLAALEPFLATGKLSPATVSVWDNGAIMAFQFRAPDLDMTILGRDVVSPLLTLCYAYGYPLADSAFFADVRWACKNQMGHVGKLMTSDTRVRHRGDVRSKYWEILSTRLEELGGEVEQRYAIMRRMTTAELTGKALYNYFGSVMGATSEETDMAWVSPAEVLRGTPAKIPAILECYRADTAGAEGTVWQAYNAVTRYETHESGYTEASRMRRMLLGAGVKVANEALEQAAMLVAA